MSTVSATSQSALDLASLESMKRRARETPQAGQREVAQQFEALFLQMMIKSMREATPKEGLFDSDQARMMQSLQDEQMALHLSRPGIGLAQALLSQMQRFSGDQDLAGAAAGAMAPAHAVSAFQPLEQPLRLFQESSDQGGIKRTAASALLDSIRASTVEARQRLTRTTGLGDVADPPAHVERFVDKLVDSARAVAHASGLPLRLILGQAALESGWGKREIRMADGSNSYNVFGIKATGGWSGKVAEVTTTEYENGVARKVRQPFRAYDSYEHALADYARLITGSPRYQSVVDAANEQDAARKIQAAGYATDPNYADKLINVMARLSI